MKAPRKPKISNLEDHLGYWLRCLSNFVSGSFSDRLAAREISVAQWVVLRILYDYENLSLNETAHLVGVDKSTLSRMIDRLVERGLIDRAEGKNRRSIGLNLTPDARRLVPELAALADENDRSFFKSLEPERRREFLATLQHLLNVNGWEIPTRGGDRIK